MTTLANTANTGMLLQAAVAQGLRIAKNDEALKKPKMMMLKTDTMLRFLEY